MSKDLEIKLKREIVFEDNSEELYDVMVRYFGTKEEIKRYNDSCDVVATVDTYINSEAKDIPIQVMKDLIQKAEDAGANFIQIDYHCDHEEYEVYGSKITRLDEAEILKIKKKKVLLTKKQNEETITNLQASIDKLVKENLKLGKV